MDDRWPPLEAARASTTLFEVWRDALALVLVAVTLVAAVAGVVRSNREFSDVAPRVYLFVAQDLVGEHRSGVATAGDDCGWWTLDLIPSATWRPLTSDLIRLQWRRPPGSWRALARTEDGGDELGLEALVVGDDGLVSAVAASGGLIRIDHDGGWFEATFPVDGYDLHASGRWSCEVRAESRRR